MPAPSGGNIAIPAIGTISDPKKVRVALVQGQQLVSAPATALSDALGIPAGGTTGQVLTKSSDADYDSDWADVPTQGDVTGPASSTDSDFAVFDGATGKIIKDSGKKASDFATAAQGALADSAVQPGVLATVATSGSYNDLSGRPTLREVLTANRTLYVRTTGADTNDGLATGTALLTVQAAVNKALAYDMSIYSVTIDVGAGTFAEGGSLSITGNGNARITLQGDSYTTTTISGTVHGLDALGGLSLTIKNLKISTTGSTGLQVRYGAQVFLTGSVAFGGGSVRLLYADNGGYIEGVGAGTAIYLASNSSYAFYAAALGNMVIGISATIYTTAARTFTATANANSGGQIAFGSAVFNVSSGAVTGARYAVSLNGIINTSGGGASFIPGSTSGTTATGGQYA